MTCLIFTFNTLIIKIINSPVPLVKLEVGVTACGVAGVSKTLNKHILKSGINFYENLKFGIKLHGNLKSGIDFYENKFLCTFKIWCIKLIFTRMNLKSGINFYVHVLNFYVHFKIQCVNFYKNKFSVTWRINFLQD